MTDADAGREAPSRLDDWLVHEIRFTVFPKEAFQLDPAELWETVFGEPAQDVRSKPREHSARASGAWRGTSLSVSIAPARADIRLDVSQTSTDDEDAAEPTKYPAIGTWSELAPDFTELVEYWLPQFPELTRLAVGATLLHPTDSRESGLQLLDTLLPAVEINHDDTRDLAYQINRRRPSDSMKSGRQINRLGHWALASFVDISAQVRTDEPSLGITTRSPEVFAVQLKLDVNTAPEYTDPVPAKEIVPLVKELFAMAEMIAREGDKL